MNKLIRGRQGSIFVVASVLITLAWLGLAMTILMVAGRYRDASRLRLTSASLHLAEAGVEKALWELSRNPGYQGEEDTSLDIGTFSVEVRPESGGVAVVATGFIPNRHAPQARGTVRVLAAKAVSGWRAASWSRL